MRCANAFTSAVDAFCNAMLPIWTSAIPAMPALETNSLSSGESALLVPPVTCVVVAEAVDVSEAASTVPVVSVSGWPAFSSRQAVSVNASASTAMIVRIFIMPGGIA
jgi:hypothetical protein